jgi:hypothetical protein
MAVETGLVRRPITEAEESMSGSRAKLTTTTIRPSDEVAQPSDTAHTKPISPASTWVVGPNIFHTARFIPPPQQQT